MPTNVLNDDLLVRGTLRADFVQMPVNSVGDNEFKSADPLTVEKQRHQYSQLYSEDSGSAITDINGKAIHTARADGTIRAFRAGVVVACVGAATIDVDLLKNGTTVLSSALELDNTNTAYAIEDGTINTAAYSADDVFTITITGTAGGGTLGQGIFVELVVDEEES